MVTWAAQRSGLYYTAINKHLRSAEVQYILDDCGAVALVTSAAMADVVAGLDLSRITVRVSASGDVDGFERYDDVLAASEPMPEDQAREGREMLYSSGTTGRPKGVRKPLVAVPFGDPAAPPVLIAKGLEMRGALDVATALSGGARGARLAIVDGLTGFVWAPGGHTRGVVEFTIDDGRILAINVTGDARRIAELDLFLLDEEA